MRLFANERITVEQSRYLDAWRGASAIAVLFGHLVPLYFDGERIFPALAGAAVMAFFCISGFFIHKSVVARTGPSGLDWRSYAAGRINRIVPTFVFALAVTWACWAVAPHVFVSGTRMFLEPTIRDSISLDGFWRTAFFLNNFVGRTVSANGPLWSLSYEVWFYFGAAALFAGLAGNKTAFAALVPIPVLIVLNPLFIVWGSCWAMGVVVSILHSNGRLPDLSVRFDRAVAMLPLCGLVGVVLVPDDLVYWATPTFQVLFGLWFAVHMARALTVTALPKAPRMAAAANFSYTLYVIHFPLLLLAYGINESRWFAPVAGLAILAFAAFVGPRVEGIEIMRRRKPVGVMVA